MKKLVAYCIVLLFAGIHTGQAQSVTGRWKTFDDETGAAKSIVEIYEKNDKIYGKVVEILEKGKEDKTCEKCKGSKKDKPIKGLVIIEGLSKNDDTWEGGTILDPKNGKEYKCHINLENKDKLKVRGYIGFSLLGRTQYWTRVEK
ncbi:hypothetical protein ASG38_14725 [Flavobacterium sp. Leaf359]|jgi:uncharacterized protein (DUF2147 family)|uniref:DUF2147 domain-containing protein n=1 Tax=Flavobacterium sp. Leaf359 TaxID=1736351 RepID=UPI0006F35C37|nr:DUF2147 domain-containing protein [Flavobacterium sp. Leaf359]KQS45865.1 hypothetical protein ASG38_14725 [Flavobacterium sp. Leaf359]